MKTEEIEIQVPKGYEIDEEKSTFEKIVLKKKKVIVNCWEDIKKINGIYIDSYSDFSSCVGRSNSHRHHNVFLNEKYAKSALALAQISQLLPYYDSKVNWFSDIYKYCITKEFDKLVIRKWQSAYQLLAFNTEEEAQRFLKHNEQLVKDYFMID